MTINETKAEAIFLIAVDFWKEKGKSDSEISEICNTDEGIKVFLKPAIEIYENLKANF